MSWDKGFPIKYKRIMRNSYSCRPAIYSRISGSDSRTIMLEAVECRFRTYRAPTVVEMLTDNGSPYVARDMQIFARQLGLTPCFTPIRSPQSNGMSEAFVKTLKRN